MTTPEPRPTIVTARIAADDPPDAAAAVSEATDDASTEAPPAAKPVEEAAEATTEPSPDEAADAFILDQAMLTAACELLPDRVALIAILPLQLRMVYSIGKRHGQQFDMAQVADLAAVVGVGAAGQVLEGVVRGVIGTVGRGLFGGLLGRATGVAAGAAVTFATTYALGKAAERYYAQGRQIDTDDLRTMFGQFREEAGTLYPRAEARIKELAAGTNVESLFSSLRSQTGF